MRFVKTKLIWFFLVYQLAFVLWAWMSYVENGALPPPFFRDVNDTFMDFFNVNWWAKTGVFYEVWRSIYTPLNIAIANILTPPFETNSIDPDGLRDRDVTTVILFIGTTWLWIGVGLYKLLSGVKNRLIWVLLMQISFPMLFAIERGNYILFTAAVVTSLVAMKKQEYDAPSRIGVMSVAVMSKLHVSILLLESLLVGKYKFILKVIVSILLGSLAIGLVLGENGWYKIPVNMFEFIGKDVSSDPFGRAAPQLSLWGYDTWFSNRLSKVLILVLETLTLGYFIVVYILTTFKYRSGRIGYERFQLATLLLFMLIFGKSIGYYSLILLFPFVASELKNNTNYVFRAIFALLLIALPFSLGSSDFAILQLDSYLSGQNVLVGFNLTLQSIIPPLLISSLFVLLTHDGSLGEEYNRIARSLMFVKAFDTGILRLKDYFNRKKHEGFIEMRSMQSFVFKLLLVIIALVIVTEYMSARLGSAMREFNTDSVKLTNKLYMKGIIVNPEVFYQSSYIRESRGDILGAISDLSLGLGLIISKCDDQSYSAKFYDRINFLKKLPGITE